EDNPVNELVMRQMLIRLGCTVRVARGGAQAVAQWEQGGIDLILMDVQMPGMSGLEATRRIRETEVRRRMGRQPIIAVTAGAMSGDRQACLDAGMDGYVAKPVEPHRLVSEMDRVLASGTRHASEAAPAADTTKPPVSVASDRLEKQRSSPQPAVDIDKLRRRLDGDESTLQ
ncbi:response regulator, partial [Arthrospira platensis SPKY1]|nr:response regulator [Arthrospira platensis SPKY1]